jgi:hypothetical protein
MSPLRRLRIWNIQHHFVATWVFWVIVVALVIWW